MWVIPPPLPGASRADRNWFRHELDEGEREIRYIWSNVCSVAGLSQVQSPPYPYLTAPQIGRIVLWSSPARFSVRMRYGQLLRDFDRRKERIAKAFGVAAVEMEYLSQVDDQWIVIRLLDRVAPREVEPPASLAPAQPPEPIMPATSPGHEPAVPEPVGVGGPRSLRRHGHQATRPTPVPADGRTPTPSPTDDEAGTPTGSPAVVSAPSGGDTVATASVLHHRVWAAMSAVARGMAVAAGGGRLLPP